MQTIHALLEWNISNMLPGKRVSSFPQDVWLPPPSNQVKLNSMALSTIFPSLQVWVVSSVAAQAL